MPYLSDFGHLYTPMTLSGVLFILWAASFILLPIIKRIWGAPGERAGTSVGVIASVLFVGSLMVQTHRFWAIPVLIGVPLIGWLSEVVGWRTGFPFGRYRYTEVLQPQLLHVPVIIPMAWLMMMPSSWAVGVTVAPNSPILQWLVAAAAFTAWDLFVDPQMVNSNYWQWEKDGAYNGIPLINFVGWFAVAFVITAVFGLISFVVPVDMVAGVFVGPLLVVYGTTWILQSIGHLLFWKLRVSALVGFLGMGVPVALVLLRIFGVFQ